VPNHKRRTASLRGRPRLHFAPRDRFASTTPSIRNRGEGAQRDQLERRLTSVYTRDEITTEKDTTRSVRIHRAAEKRSSRKLGFETGLLDLPFRHASGEDNREGVCSRRPDKIHSYHPP
jgi:hypothetical protein